MNQSLQNDVLTRTIATLPPEKVQEVVDFALFLQRQYGDPKKIEYDGTWPDEDMKAFSKSVWERANREDPWEEPSSENPQPQS